MRIFAVDQNWLWRKAGLAVSFLIVVAITVMTLTPMPATRSITSGIDKIYHFVAFGAIIFPLIVTDSRRWYWAVPAVIVYGGLIELIQPGVGRSAEWLDFGADITGVMAGAALAELLHDRIHKSVFDGVPVNEDTDEEAEAERLERMREELREELRVVLMEELSTMHPAPTDNRAEVTLDAHSVPAPDQARGELAEAAQADDSTPEAQKLRRQIVTEAAQPMVAPQPSVHQLATRPRLRQRR